MMSELAHFHFLRPGWLLIALPALVVAVLRLVRTRPSQKWARFIAPHLLEHLLSRPSHSPWLSPEVMLFPCALVFAVALAGPAYQLADAPNGPDDTTLIVVVDLSSSMAGRDIGPSRIGRLKLKLRDLIDLRRGSRVGVIAVAGSAHVVMPPTDDTDALIPYLNVLAPDLMPSDGEHFAQAVPLIEQLLAQRGGPSVVLVAADSLPPDGATALAALQHKGVTVVGWVVGTEHGVPSAGVPGVDRVGFSALGRAGATVVDLTLGESDVRHLDALLDAARTAQVDPKDATLWQDAGYGLSFLGALAVMLWFRRGWVLGRLSVGLLALLLGGCSPERAEDMWWDLWLTPDQQGRRLFEQGKYRQAAQVFDDPMWKGTAYYVATDWRSAQAQFARVDTTHGLFNLANAHAQAKELASAIDVYGQVLEREPTFVAARLNRDYFQELLAGLAQTTDFDTLKTPDAAAADPTRAKLRRDQTQGVHDRAAEAQQKHDSKAALSPSESQQWLSRVSTNPADFLRSKFATLDAKRAP